LPHIHSNNLSWLLLPEVALAKKKLRYQNNMFSLLSLSLRINDKKSVRRSGFEHARSHLLR
jgi:hypothetical protein